MQVIIAAALFLTDAPAAVIDALRVALRFANPDYLRRERMGLYLGATSRYLDAVTGGAGRHHLPRGCIDTLREICERLNVEVFWDVQTTHLKPRPDVIDHTTIRDEQEPAVAFLASHTDAMLIAPCGAGKTTIGISAAVRAGQPTLVIVYTHELLDQWRGRIKSATGADADVISAGIKDDTGAFFTVATVQTLVRMDDLAFRRVATRFGTVILDEAHHAPASTFWSVLSRLPAQNRWGLSATPERDDGLTPLLRWAFGGAVYAIDRGELVEAGHLQVPTVREIVTSFDFDWSGPDDWNRCMAALVADVERNAAILDLVACEARDGHTVLVLSGRVEHCNALASGLRAMGTEAAALVGPTPKKERAAILARFREGELRVVCSSTLADEGLDVPRLDRLVLATPSKAQGRTVQRIGRVARVAPGKLPPIVYDFVDILVPPLKWQARARRRAYAEIVGGAA